MASDSGRELRAQAAAISAPDPAARRPAGQTGEWTPGYRLDGDTGELVTHHLPGDAHPDWVSIFAHWNLDPDAWEVVDGTLRVNAWEGPTSDGHRVFRQYKAAIRRRPDASRAPVVDAALDRLARFTPKRRAPAERPSPASFVSSWADWQVGGHGTVEDFTARLEASVERVAVRARQAAKAGVTHAVVGFLGDMVEGCMAQYAAQQFEVTLDQRAQNRMVRNGEALVVRTIAPLFDRTDVVAVPGNHGKNTPKVVTTPSDNHDLECFEVTAEKLTESGFAAEHGVRFIENPESIIALVNASGTQLLWVHGDQVNGSADNIRKWWKDTAFTRWQDADLGHILLAGHRHHLRVEELAVDRWLIQCPTLGGDSVWFAELGGGTSMPGTVCFTTAGGRWWDLHVEGNAR